MGAQCIWLACTHARTRMATKCLTGHNRISDPWTLIQRFSPLVQYLTVCALDPHSRPRFLALTSKCRKPSYYPRRRSEISGAFFEDTILGHKYQNHPNRLRMKPTFCHKSEFDYRMQRVSGSLHGYPPPPHTHPVTHPNATHTNFNNVYMFSANYFIVGTH